jgi:hypothetical protein
LSRLGAGLFAEYLLLLKKRLQDLTKNVILDAATSAKDLCRKKAACPKTQEGKKLHFLLALGKGVGAWIFI